MGWWNKLVRDKKAQEDIPPVYEKGYPSYEAVNNKESEEFDYDTYGGGVEYFGKSQNN